MLEFIKSLTYYLAVAALLVFSANEYVGNLITGLGIFWWAYGLYTWYSASNLWTGEIKSENDYKVLHKIYKTAIWRTWANVALQIVLCAMGFWVAFVGNGVMIFSGLIVVGSLDRKLNSFLVKNTAQ